MSDDFKRWTARELCTRALRAGRPIAWFEELYAQGRGDAARIPWGDLEPNPGFVEWCRRERIDGAGRRALKVGCGLGDDAEELGRLGFEVVAFDASATAIEWCRERFPASRVRYEAQDLLEAPELWTGAFDLVLEAYTLQVLPPELRPAAIDCIARTVAPAGTLLVIARGRDAGDDPGSMPWPLTRGELGRFAEAGLDEVRFEDYRDREEPPVRRFRVEYRRSP